MQVNLELAQELDKEVKINLENEAKIKRLERQQARYEEDIQYLYDVIRKLESHISCSDKELQTLREQLEESHKRLKNSERLCEEKEEFILFRESQLLESEDTIYKLKQRILALVAERHSRRMSGSRTRSRSNSRSRADILSLETLANPLLLDEITGSVEELCTFAVGGNLPNVRVAEHLRNRITRASELIYEDAERLSAGREELIDEIAECREEIHRLNESVQGADIEVTESDARIEELENTLREALRESQAETDEVTRDLETLLDQTRTLETNYDRLVADLQRDLDQARQDRDNLRREAREIIEADQHNITRLKRQIGILRFQNQWR